MLREINDKEEKSEETETEDTFEIPMPSSCFMDGVSISGFSPSPFHLGTETEEKE